MQATTSGLLGLTQNNQMRLNFRTTGTLAERLSSGIRINKGADDPSGLGITSGMRATLGGIDQAIINAQDGLKMIRTSDSGLNEIQDLVLRGYELAVKAANFAVNNDQDLQRIQSEVDTIVDAIDQIANSKAYNTKTLLDGGGGQSFDITTQADFTAGTQSVPGTLDYDTKPGSMLLNLIDPTTIAALSTAAPNSVSRILCPYVTAYTDNGDGTVNITLRIKARSQAGNTVYDGTMKFDSSATLVSLNANVNGADNVVNWNAGTQTLDFNAAGGQIRASTTYQDEVEVQLQLDKNPAAMRMEFELINPTGNPLTKTYFGTTLLVDGLGRYSTQAFMTDIETTGTWASTAFDTGNQSGEATLSWNATTVGGTQALVRVYQSATGVGGWTPIALVENGGTFDYTEQFLRTEAILTTPGIAFGTPELEDIQIKTKESGVLQIGENTVADHRIAFGSQDARSAALGLQGIDVTVSRKVVKQYDTSAEWQAGIVSNPNGLIDSLGDPGFLRLSSPISAQPAAQAQNNGQNMYIKIDQASLDPSSGQYDMKMSVSVYGQAPTVNGANATGWIGSIQMFNGDGTRITLHDVNNISQEPPAGVPVYVVGAGIGPGQASTSDANFLDTDNNGTPDTYVGTIAQGNTYGGGNADMIYFDWGTTTAQDGVDFQFTADPDAYIVVNFDCVGFTGAKVTTTDEPCNVYFHDELIATNFDNSPATQTITYRLQEYGTQPPAYAPPAVPTGDFTTGAFFFGASKTGFLNISETLNGGATTYTVEESPDGIAGWVPLVVNPLDNSFATTQDYLRINGQLQGQGPTLNLNPHTYTMSTTPVIDSIRIQSDSNAIFDFQEANRRVSEMRAELGVVENRLQHIINDLTAQRTNITAAKSRLLDADMALEATNVAKQQILNDSTTALKAQGDPFMQSILDLQKEHDVGRHAIGNGI